MSIAETPTEIPLGLCQCGCGRKTNLVPATNNARGYAKGQPYRYLRGHALGLRRTGQFEIDLEILREAFRRSGLRLTDVARALDWYDRGRPDSNRVARQLGLVPYPIRRGRSDYRRTTSYKRAVELVVAMGFDPVDFGL